MKDMKKGPQVLMKFTVVFFVPLMALLFFLQGPYAQATPNLLAPTELVIDISEVDSFQARYSLSAFQSSDESYSLTADGSNLTDGTISVPLSSISPILQSLHTLYPGTRPIFVQRWTDDYPYAEVTIALKDGRYLLITSQSQYGRLIPWNVQVWEGNPYENGTIQSSYILLHEDFHAGLSELWLELTGNTFPRDYGPERFWDYYEKTETIDFYVYDSYAPGTKIEIAGAPTGVIEPFLPLLEGNSVIASLREDGYSVFDLSFDVTVTVEQMRPVQYSGTIAFIAPDGKDVIVTTVDVQLEPELLVETPLTKIEVESRLTERRGFPFLEEVSQLFPDIIYLLDTRESVEPLMADCPENDSMDHTGFSVQALLKHHDNLPVVFYYFDESEAWSMDLSLDREYGYWDDQIADTVLTHWFPADFPALSPSDLSTLTTNFEIAFRVNTSHEKRSLVDVLHASLPSETFVHYAHPQKVGDISLVRLLGRVVVPNNGESPQVVYCGYTRPDWYGPPYQSELVVTPHEGMRSEFYEAVEGAWTSSIELRNGKSGADWTTLGVSEPGFVHLLWTTDKGVYYADGWADGSEWSETQRLGDGSWNMDIATNTSGEVHLLWSTHYAPVGSMHVWKNDQGEWQEPEYWEGIGYFSQSILDQAGVLHLGYQDSDGLDAEFFYQNWTRQNGLSEPENVSRRLGDGGDGILRIDSQNNVHAVWSHPLNSSQYIDPLSGQIFDQVGVFYSRRLGPSDWTSPEQIGTLASFAYSMDFILTDQDEPVVAWQSEDGIVTSIMHDGSWTEPYLLATAIPPNTPAPFGPDRWGEVTAEIRLGKDNKGNVFGAWVTTANGLYLAKYDGNEWLTPQQISEPGVIFSLNMAVTSNGVTHLLYFKNTDLHIYPHLYHTLIAQDGITTTEFDVSYTGYGLDDNQLLLDEAGYVYALGLPRTPSWFVFIPQNGIRPPATPTPVITLTPTPLAPTQTPASLPTAIPTLTITIPSQDNYPTSTPLANEGAQSSNTGFLTGFLVIAGLGIVAGWIVVRKIK
ncbi:MAG: hypothetical protein KA314_12055 [Chloroflexi bacterium]|nr:hypothetical protein [Chloroflexota bacterium]MBP8056568.1 hypothetical protein [Chloroflexota bacterium]